MMKFNPINKILGKNVIKDRYSHNKGEYTANSLYKMFVEEDLIEDRREYDVEELMTSYPGLSLSEAKKLYNMVQRKAWGK